MRITLHFDNMWIYEGFVKRKWNRAAGSSVLNIIQTNEAFYSSDFIFKIWFETQLHEVFVTRLLPFFFILIDILCKMTEYFCIHQLLSRCSPL